MSSFCQTLNQIKSSDLQTSSVAICVLHTNKNVHEMPSEDVIE